MNKDIVFEELYPYIIVYKNMFNDIDKIYSIIKESESNNQGFFNWHQWSRFGNYVTNYPFKININSIDMKVEEDYIPKNQQDQEQKDFMFELIRNIFEVNKHYINMYDIKINTEEKVNVDGQECHRWKWEAPNICAYNPTEDNSNKAMNYHSDYIREPIVSPGYKFVFTTLAYFNDDYADGGLDFAINKKLVGYKPQAGDIIVFPSGHPDFLTEDGKVYLHGVEAIRGSKKYFSRSYWMRYEPGSEEWLKNETLYGRSKWLEMQNDIMDKFRTEYPQRSFIENGVRIR